MPRADVGDLLLGVPRVEAAALGAARADPLHVLHGDGDVGVRNVGALRRERDERGAHPGRLIDEVGQLDADVDRGRVHADRGAVGDPLPRHVGDLALDLVVVADAVAALRLELDLEAAVGVGRVLVGAQLGAAVGRRPGAEVEALEREVAEQRRRRAVGRGARIGPAHRRALHRRPEQVAGRHGARQRRAGERRRAGQGRVDAEVGPAVGRHEEAAADRIARLDGVGLALDLVRDVQLAHQLRGRLLRRGGERPQPHQHRIVAERAFGRQRLRPLDRAPRRQLHLALIDLAILAVAHADVDRRAGVGHLDAGGGVVAEDGLEVHLLAEAVDAAIREHGAAQQRVLLGGVVADAELPGIDAFGPVRAEVGGIAVLLGHHQELELRSRTSASGRAAAAPARWRRRRRWWCRSRRPGSRCVTIDTLAPSTGSALSRRVTNTSVFCGLSFTVRPRLVTWTTVARVRCGSP